MKTEKILSRIHEIIDMSVEPVTRLALEDLSAELAEQVRAEYAASRGEANAARTITALLKAVKKSNPTTALRYAWIDGEGRQCVCDGDRAFRLKEPLPLEERPAGAGEPIDLEKIFKSVKCCAAAPLPDAKELKAFIALERAKKGRKAVLAWDFGEGKPAVNAAYLLDLLNVLPDAAEIHYGKPLEPLYAKSERGEALLMPIRKLAKPRSEVMGAMLAEYAERVKANPEYALTPDAFADMAKYAAKTLLGYLRGAIDAIQPCTPRLAQTKADAALIMGMLEARAAEEGHEPGADDEFEELGGWLRTILDALDAADPDNIERYQALKNAVKAIETLAGKYRFAA